MVKKTTKKKVNKKTTKKTELPVQEAQAQKNYLNLISDVDTLRQNIMASFVEISKFLKDHRGKGQYPISVDLLYVKLQEVDIHAKVVSSEIANIVTGEMKRIEEKMAKNAEAQEKNEN